MSEQGVPRIIDREQLAARLGIRRQQLAEVTADDGFPPAVGYYRGRHLWASADIDRWAAGSEQRRQAGVAPAA